MAATEPTQLKPGRGLRLTGAVILVVGFIIAGAVYGLRKPTETLPNELSSPDDFKKGARDIESNYGKVGAFSYSLDRDLQDPTIQAGLIALGSIVVAGGCFFLAELQGHGNPPLPPSTPP